MSNHRAIATVTAALKLALQNALNVDFSGAQTTSVRPNAPATELPNPYGVNVFLYQVTPNAAFRNADLTTRRADKTLRQAPQVALDLHYLLTFHGAEANYEPQIMMGIVARALHADPVLSKADINAAIALDSTGNLAGSDLADQIEPVKFTPTALSLEEISKLWSVMLQTPYVLSMAFHASLVLIEKPTIISAPLPVRDVNVVAYPVLRPAIERVLIEGPGGEPISGPILSSSVLVIQGTELKGDQTWVRFGDVVVAPTSVSENEVRVPVPSSLRAGAQGVQISQKVEVSAGVFLQGAESNARSFVLHPKATFARTGTTVNVSAIAPNVGIRQRVALVLTEKPPGVIPAGFRPLSYTFVMKDRVVGADETKLDIATTGVTAGKDYLVRLQVDGAETALVSSPAGRYTGPTLTF